MKRRPDIDDVMARIIRFCTRGEMGDALVQVNLRTPGCGVKGLDQR